MGMDDDPVESFVQKKLEADFTATGTAACRRYLRRRATSEAAWRHGYEHNGFEHVGFEDAGGDRYKKLLIPGSIYHMRKRGAERGGASGGGGGAAGATIDRTALGESKKLYWVEREPPEEVRGEE